MSLNPRTFFLTLLLLTGAKAQEVWSEASLENDGYIITDMSDQEMLEAAAGGSEPYFLRGRELQSAGTCRANNPAYTTVCGMLPAFPDDTTCLNSQATCNGLQYPCTCSGSGETSCSYCTIKMAGAVVCQVSGSAMTFADTESLMTTCRCTYLGNGQVQQNCFHPTPQPVAVPTFWPVYSASDRAPAAAPVPVSNANTPAPVYRAPVSYTVTTGGPVSRPISYTPVVMHYGTPAPVSQAQNRPTPVYTRPAPTAVPQTVPAVPASGAAAGQGKNNNNNNKNKNKKQ